jgi:hypothetical protein
LPGACNVAVRHDGYVDPESGCNERPDSWTQERSNVDPRRSAGIALLFALWATKKNHIHRENRTLDSSPLIVAAARTPVVRDFRQKAPSQLEKLPMVYKVGLDS